MTLSRGIGATLLAALGNDVRHPVLLIDMDWPSGRARMNTNSGTITWNGQTWTGVSYAASVELPGGASGFARQEGVIRIVGTLEALFSAATEAVKNRSSIVYYGQTTTRNGSTLIGDPFVRWNGYMDGLEVVGQGGQYWLEVTLASGPGARSVASLEHTYEDQIAEYPGDTAGRHTAFAEANAAKLKWPQ